MAQTPFEKFVKKYGTATAILLGAGIIGAAILFSSGSIEWPAAESGLATKGTESPAVGQRQEVSADDDPALGDAKAPVVMIEFGDFQCPFCRSFWRDTLPEINKNYIATGKVKFVYRDFPLSFHPAALPAAQAVNCALEQGKFWELHDKIFAEQDQEGQGTVSFNTSDLQNWAGELGLNPQPFNSCLESGKYKTEIEKDVADGLKAGVTGTPSFFLNGRHLEGAQPYANFAAVLDQELAKKK